MRYLLLILSITAFTARPGDAQRILVDHHSVALFGDIPAQYVNAARGLRMLFMDRSVGGNINDALSCLSHPHAEAPNFCKRFAHRDSTYAVSPSEVYWEGSWDRGNWRYEFWPDGCSEEALCFINAVEPRIDSFDVVGFQFSYLAVGTGSKLADPSVGFFTPGGGGTKATQYVAFADRHPDKTVIWWTTSLARGIGTQESQDFNESMRDYARIQDVVLFDVADILSHDPAGNPCYDNRDGVSYLAENHPDDGMDIPAICPQYTTETEGGHLGSISAGGIRVAKAFWVLMAKIAGWDGSVSGVREKGSAPSGITMDVAPNPARGQLHVRLNSAQEAVVLLQLTDMLGRVIARPADGMLLQPGSRTVCIAAGHLPCGSYCLILTSPRQRIVCRVALL
jgi:hypothetical protein